MGTIEEYKRLSKIKNSGVELRRAKRQHKAPEGECSYCDREREKGNSFHPPHHASSMCESGGHEHCSCDCCF